MLDLSLPCYNADNVRKVASFFRGGRLSCRGLIPIAERVVRCEVGSYLESDSLHLREYTILLFIALHCYV